MFRVKLLLLKTLQVVNFFRRVTCERKKKEEIDPNVWYNHPPAYHDPCDYIRILLRTRNCLLERGINNWDVIEMILEEQIKTMIDKLAHETTRGIVNTSLDLKVEYARARNRYHSMCALHMLLTMKINEDCTFNVEHCSRPEYFWLRESCLDFPMTRDEIIDLRQQLHSLYRVHEVRYRAGVKVSGIRGSHVYMDRRGLCLAWVESAARWDY